MKILKMIGLVVAVHVVAFAFLALPACQSSVRTSPQKPAEPDTSNMTRLDAARARTGGPVPADTALVRNEPAPASQPAQAQSASGGYAYTPAGGPAFSGGAPVTGFGTPVVAAGIPPAHPQTGAEAAALPAEPEQEPATLTYTVVANDNPWTIARKFKITTKQLTDANNLPANPRLQIGQKLKIPAKPAANASLGANVYKVKSGDSLANIARRYNTTVEHIQTLNNMRGTSVIRVNQELVVPAGATTDSPAAFGAQQSGESATAPASMSAKSGGTTIIHTVKTGESLSGIASYYGTTRNAIAVASHITNPNVLREGQKLTVPNATRNIANATPAADSATPGAAPASTQTATATIAPVPASTAATATASNITETPVLSPIINPGTAPVSPISPVNESPVSATPADTPPVNVPVDASPIGVPQN